MSVIAKIFDDNTTVAMICLTILGGGCLVSLCLGASEVKDAFNVLIGAMAGMAMGKSRTLG